MQTSINERIKILIDAYESGVPARFAKKIGVSASVVANYLPGSQREGEPSFSVLQKILAAYPQVNIDWLLMNKGEMLEDTGTNSATPPGNLHHYVGSSSNKINVGGVPTSPESSDIDYYRQRIRELEKKYDTLLEKYERLLTKKE